MAEGTAAEGERSAAGALADGIADVWLLRAAGIGALLSLIGVLPGLSERGGYWTPWGTFDPAALLPGHAVVLFPYLVPSVLIFAAWFFSSRMEARLGVRRQRGALALLGFAAIGLGLLLGGPFNGVYGVSLLALSLRTRQTLTAATGVIDRKSTRLNSSHWE